MKKYTIFFALLASLTITSGLQAQYRWHVIHPDRIDTFYYGFNNISCSGESCSAVGVVWGHTPGEPLFHQLTDSNFVIHSTDGGITWNSVDDIPQVILHPHPGVHFYFDKIQQIDSLDAIAVDEQAGATIQTFDGWQTFQADTSNLPTQVFGNDTQFDGGYSDVDFSNAAEGMVNGEYGFYYSTLDSGKHWDKLIMKNGATFHAYGSGMFRVFVPPNAILTTHDNWMTSDTSFIALTDSIQSPPLVTPQFLSFGGNDSLTVLSLRWDSTMTHYSLSIALSSDLGRDWEFPLHDTVAMQPTAISPLGNQTIVITGEDSSQRIVMSTDGGSTWHVYSVPLDNGAPYYWIRSVAVTDSGRVIANIVTDSNYLGSNLLVYLEAVPSGVAPAVSTQANLTLYPNPATNVLNIPSSTGTITIADPLGRSYNVKQSGNTLDISTLPSGVYFISDGVSRAKFVKE